VVVCCMVTPAIFSHQMHLVSL